MATRRARSPAQWHRDHRRVTAGRAGRDVTTAHTLAALPRTAAAVADGTITADQAAIAARAANGLTNQQTAELDDVVAGVAPDATDRQVRDAVTEFTHRVSPHDVADRERQAHQRRRLAIGQCADGGWWIDARLDIVGGATVAAAISALSAPRGDADERTAQQRRADALVDLAERAAREGDLPVEGGARPVVTVTADLATLEDRAGAPAGRGDHAGAVSADTVRQLACDAHIHRVITHGASGILDVGRATRTVSTTQRRALAVRDGGCVGCGAPPGWTDAHHVIHWADGGPTDLDNLVLLCRTCHTGVHHRRYRLTRNPDSGRWRVHRPYRRAPNEPAPPTQTASDHRATPGDEARPDHRTPPGDGAPPARSTPDDGAPPHHATPPHHGAPPDHATPPHHGAPPDHAAPPDRDAQPDPGAPPDRGAPPDHEAQPDPGAPPDHDAQPDPGAPRDNGVRPDREARPQRAAPTPERTTQADSDRPQPTDDDDRAQQLTLA
jgi:hypothetical protein